MWEGKVSGVRCGGFWCWMWDIRLGVGRSEVRVSEGSLESGYMVWSRG